VAYDVREASIEFLRFACVSMKQEYITRMIETQLRQFKEQPLVNVRLVMAGEEVTLTTFQNMPIAQNQLWTCILQREAFYYIVAKLIRLLKDEIDFEEWFYGYLYGELIEPNPLFLPVKLQILSMTYNFFSSQQEVPLDFCNLIATTCL
jgi:hypothetical protein